MPTHAEKRLLPYEPEQLFELVADVERYPEFLPWCLAARITQRRDNLICADLIIGFKMFREGFTSRVTLDRPANRIDVAYTRGPFRYLNNHWIFDSHPEGCLIDFYEAVGRMVAAFEARAQDLYHDDATTSVAG